MGVKRKGLFVTLEGGEGMGKSTQAKRLVDHYRSVGQDVILTREPGGSALAERLRSLLLSGTFKAAGPDVEATIFAAARSDHLAKVIGPAVERGALVICDRFFDSTAVYQTANGADPRLIEILREEAVGDMQPDVTFLLDGDTEEGLSRAKSVTKGFDRFESENMEFHARVRRHFLEIALAEPNRVVTINVDAGADAAFNRIREELDSRQGR